MIKTGKCPGCGKVPLSINIQGVDMHAPAGTFNGVMYVCPTFQCGTILGVGIDPIALKADTINGVVKKLRGKV